VLLFANEQSEMPPERQSLFVSHRQRRWFTLKESNDVILSFFSILSWKEVKDVLKA